MPDVILIVLIVCVFIFMIVAFAECKNKLVGLGLMLVWVNLLLWFILAVRLPWDVESTKILDVHTINGAQYIQLDNDTLINLNKEMGIVLPAESRVKVTQYRQNFYGGVLFTDKRANDYEVVR